MCSPPHRAKLYADGSRTPHPIPKQTGQCLSITDCQECGVATIYPRCVIPVLPGARTHPACLQACRPSPKVRGLVFEFARRLDTPFYALDLRISTAAPNHWGAKRRAVQASYSWGDMWPAEPIYWLARCSYFSVRGLYRSPACMRWQLNSLEKIASSANMKTW
jgi:hypothetical protein